MSVKQISVFVENTPGELSKFVDVLSDNHIDMRALSIAETRDFGILRIIVDDAYEASTVLKSAGYILKITPVLAAAVPDEPGALKKILKVLEENQINVEYTYAFITRDKDIAYMVFRLDDPSQDKAEELLSRAGVRLLDQSELQEL